MTAPWDFGWSELLSIGNLIVVAAGIFVARDTFQKWQEERAAVRQAEIAENLLSAIYEAEDKFRQIRSPLSWGSEGSTRNPSKRDEETEEQRSHRDSLFVPFERIEKHAEYWHAVYKMRALVRAYFGSELLEALDEIPKIRNEIMMATRRRMYRDTQEHRYSQKTDEQIEKDIADREKLEAVIWEMSDDDPINKRIKTMIATAEGLLLPMLRKRIPS